MPWTRWDSKTHRHQKYVPLSNGAFRLQHHAVEECNDMATDGVVWEAALAVMGVGIDGKRGQATAAELLSCAQELVDGKLWHGPGESCHANSESCPAHYTPAAPGSFVIHDFWEQQPRNAAQQAKRAKLAENGQKGGIKSGESRRPKQAPAEANLKQFASPLLQEPEAIEKGVASGNRSPVPYRTVPLENNSETPVTSSTPPPLETGSLEHPSNPDPGGGDLGAPDCDLRDAEEFELDQLQRLMGWWDPKAEPPLTGGSRPRELQIGLRLIRLALPEQERLNELHRIWTERQGLDADGKPIGSLRYFWQALQRAESVAFKARPALGCSGPIHIGTVPLGGPH